MHETPTMKVLKRDGTTEPVNLDKIVRSVSRNCVNLTRVDPLRVSTKTISGLYDGASTRELDDLSIQSAAALTSEEPEYARLAARLLSQSIAKEVAFQNVHSFSQSIELGVQCGIVGPRLAKFVKTHARKLNSSVDAEGDQRFEYFGLRTLYDRYLVRHPETRQVIETPQYFFLRVACALSTSVKEALELYSMFSNLEYLPSSPTLFNAGTTHEQLSSCYLLDSPEDSLDGIYQKYWDVARLSKYAGGIGLAYHRVRSRGSLIKGTNGFSNGIISWLKTLDSSVASVNQCFAPNTLVRTAEGLREIKDVREGDLVLGQRGVYRKVLENLSYTQEGPMVEVGVKHFTEPLAVTEGHPFWVISCGPEYLTPLQILSGLDKGEISRSWVPAGELKENDYVAQVIPKEVIPVEWMTEDHATVYGIMLWYGDFSEDGKNWIVPRGTPNEQFNLIWDWLKSRNISFWVGSGGEIRWSVEGDLTQDKAFPFSYTDFFNENGNRRIPRCFSHLPYEQTLALVKGILGSEWEAETFVNDTRGPNEDLRYQLLRIGETALETNLEYEGCLWLPVTSVRSISPLAKVHDLKVEGDETYMTFSALVHNGGKRKGACCVYLETWHADVEEFLELRDNTGDEARRTHNLNLANWIPDLFMKRAEAGESWTLFDPKDVPSFPDLYGEEFEKAYLDAEAKGLGKKTLPARDLYARMMRTLAQTGNGWMTFKDKSNLACNQTALPENSVHLSNLCTEILEVTAKEETAVCNLGSINLSKHLIEDEGVLQVDYAKIASTVKRAIRQLDRVIDLNFYPIQTAKVSNSKWRPIGMGLMGLQDVFFRLGLEFDCEEARAISKSISEHIYFHALTASCDLAEDKGSHSGWAETRMSRGEFQFDSWGVTPSKDLDWAGLKERILRVGLRNSLCIAIAPTATIASIAGCYECIEPQVSNLFKRETLSGDFLQVNRYLVRELEGLGLWTEEMRNLLKINEGSIQNIESIPQAVRSVYRTAWEIPMKSLIEMAADRGPFIDQSQSLNLFVESPNIGRLSSMYMYAWKKGLKTTYYLRSRPATHIAKTTVTLPPKEEAEQAVVCSLENPETCLSCQ